jgi:hypothetical protein
MHIRLCWVRATKLDRCERKLIKRGKLVRFGSDGRESGSMNRMQSLQNNVQRTSLLAVKQAICPKQQTSIHLQLRLCRLRSDRSRRSSVQALSYASSRRRPLLQTTCCVVSAIASEIRPLIATSSSKSTAAEQDLEQSCTVLYVQGSKQG